MHAKSIQQQSVDTIRTLAVDAVEAADAGHPGTPMAPTPMAHTLWHAGKIAQRAKSLLKQRS